MAQVLQDQLWSGHPAQHPGMGDARQREIAVATKRQTQDRRVADHGKKKHSHQKSLRSTKNSTEELRVRTRGGGSGRISPESSHAARAGRQFTVGNIGNNGIIYLRPVTRSGTQRAHPAPPPFAFPPITPPDDDISDFKDHQRSRYSWRGSLFSGPRTPSTVQEDPKTTSDDESTDSPGNSPAKATSTKAPSHVRSHSFSTVDEHAKSQAADPGTFKVVIQRPSVKRPKTADVSSLPILEVPIPHYKLGIPRFSSRGTATLRSSVDTRESGTEGPQSARPSGLEYDKPRQSLTPRTQSENFLHPNYQHSSVSEASGHCASTAPAPPPRTSIVPIRPEMYDKLTANPDDPSVVRYSPTTGEIVAATPSRLISHITSPSFLDYELLSDFFLTFRAFLSVSDLVAYLIARLRWAVNRADDFGRIVRVRTFVALRHWILNYFVDDFVPDYELRVTFCALVNTLHRDLRRRSDGGGGDAKVIGELKKCWRRTCALYWDHPNHMSGEASDEDIIPGGRLGSRDSREGPAGGVSDNNIKQHSPPFQRAAEAIPTSIGPVGGGAHDVLRRSSTSAVYSSLENDVPISPASEQSMMVMSCSIPMRTLHRTEPGSNRPLYPHPVTTTNVQHCSIGRSNRPAHHHKRSGSFSDALRDRRAPVALSQDYSQRVEVLTTVTFPGSLVRGAIYQPGSPFFNVTSANSLKTNKASLDDSQTSATGPSTTKPALAANPGVKKLLGSVRRALSSKQAGNDPSTIPSNSEPGSSACPVKVTKAANAVFDSSYESPHRKRRRYAHPQKRIDLLILKIDESFAKAIMTQKEAEQQNSRRLFDPRDSQVPQGLQAQQDGAGGLRPPPGARLNSNVTMGSRSILIFDDTGALDLSGMMSGALPPAQPLKHLPRGPEAAGEPTTHKPYNPEGTAGSRPRNMSIDGIIAETHPRTGNPAAAPQARIALRVPPKAPTTAYRHSLFRRSKSAESAHSGSTSLRKYASFHSGMTPRDPGQSVVTTTVSDARTKSSDNDPFFLDRQPFRRLRRRPGGDLRAVDNVHDLEPMERPHSTGSLSNFSHSVTNSVLLLPAGLTAPAHEEYAASHVVDGRNQLPVPETVITKKPLSLVETHSSQPVLRPSFEAEVAKLAALPDDEDDDGGIESTLLKLEGRYEKRSSKSPVSESAEGPDRWSTHKARLRLHTGDEVTKEGRHIQSSASSEEHTPRPLPSDETQEASTHQMSQSSGIGTLPHNYHTTQSVAESEDSYSSIPLLERGLSAAGPSRRKGPTRNLGTPSAKPLSPRNVTVPIKQQTRLASPEASLQSSIVNVVETDSVKNIAQGTSTSVPTTPHRSFLLDENQDLSDLSSELSTELADSSEGASQDVRSFYDDAPTPVDFDSNLLHHPLRHPPTPPATADRHLEKPWPAEVPNIAKKTAAPEPIREPIMPVESTGRDAIELNEIQKIDPPPSAMHLPFSLIYDAELLAQQFTIVEKDALDEIDWKELIELRWKQTSPHVRNWVEYLQTQEPRGVDIVIARFNLMVKWALSEIVLTENIDERARCIVQYIHIAEHARKLRNYATMYQLTIALLSTDCSRLKKTWALVPDAEMTVLKDLEVLAQPLRNFHNLRVEMETAHVEDGCIPFIGVYTHDLVYNAQKPAYISGPQNDTGEPLVNFERHHTAASIVKSLLRLLEASSKYKFQPVPEVISRCIWMAALEDDEITALSRRLE